jgi:hypothetical protein
MDEYTESAENAVKALEVEPVVTEDAPIKQEPNIEEAYARQKGWRPKDEWDEGKGEWIDADEFNRRGPLFETIGKLKDEVRDSKKAVDALFEHNKKLAEQAKKAEERGREKAIKSLEEQRLAAVQDGDLEEFTRIDQEIKDHQTVEDEPADNDDPPEHNIDPSIIEWKESNDWFEKDQAMTSYMIATQQHFINQGLSIPDALKKSTEVVKQEFSHKFENQNKNKPAAVLGRQDAGSKKSYSVNDLPSEYQPVFRAIARKTDMNITEYIEQLKELGVMS